MENVLENIMVLHRRSRLSPLPSLPPSQSSSTSSSSPTTSHAAKQQQSIARVSRYRLVPSDIMCHCHTRSHIIISDNIINFKSGKYSFITTPYHHHQPPPQPPNRRRRCASLTATAALLSSSCIYRFACDDRIGLAWRLATK